MANGPSDDGRRVTPVAISHTSTLVNRTGSWKYIRPIYQDKVAPCNEACPVGIDVEGYMNLLREGRVEEAADLLLRENAMPAVTGRVCHRPCEAACNRSRFDEAVSIHAVERTLGDQANQLQLPEPAEPVRPERVAVIGSGPAGLACAYHLARFGYGVVVYEAAPEPGGMLRLGIPEYRLPRRVLDREIERIRSQGVDIRCGVRVGVDMPWSALDVFDALFLATGAHTSRPLGVEGEELEGVRPGLEFLKQVNRGERPDLGERVIVVGGGNTAIDCARTALRLRAEVSVLYRRSRAEMPAIPEEVEEAEREGVHLIFLAAPAVFRGVDGRLRIVEAMRMRLGPLDASGRRRPIATDERFTLPADTVLAAIGEDTDLDSLPHDLERRGSALCVDELGATTGAATFAGGDVAGETRTVAHALGSGKRAAISIHSSLCARAGEYLRAEDLGYLRYGPRGNVSITRWRGDDPIVRASPLNQVISFEELNTNHFVALPRNPDRRRTDAESLSSFDAVNLGLKPVIALCEANRCFNCGVCNRCELCLLFCPDMAISWRADAEGFVIDDDYCKGCGVCAAECPRGAIAMTRVGL